MLALPASHLRMPSVHMPSPHAIPGTCNMQRRERAQPRSVPPPAWRRGGGGGLRLPGRLLGCATTVSLASHQQQGRQGLGVWGVPPSEASLRVLAARPETGGPSDLQVLSVRALGGSLSRPSRSRTGRKRRAHERAMCLRRAAAHGGGGQRLCCGNVAKSPHAPQPLTPSAISVAPSQASTGMSLSPYAM